MKRSILVYLILIFPFVFPIKINAKIYGNIFGKVMDVDTKMPIAGVELAFSDKFKSISNYKGYYEISLIETGIEFALKVKHKKYRGMKIYIKIPEGRNLENNIYLKKGVEVKGRVLDKLTKIPLSNIKAVTMTPIEILYKGSKKIELKMLDVETNSNGEYLFSEGLCDSTTIISENLDKFYSNFYRFSYEGANYRMYYLEKIKLKKDLHIIEDIYLEKGYIISGWILTEDSKPFIKIGEHKPWFNVRDLNTNKLISIQNQEILENSFKIYYFPPATYSFIAIYPGYFSITRSIEIVNKNIILEDLIFKKSLKIIYKLVDKETKIPLINNFIGLLELQYDSSGVFDIKNSKNIQKFSKGETDENGVGYFDGINSGYYKIHITNIGFPPDKRIYNEKITEVIEVKNNDIELTFELEKKND